MDKRFKNVLFIMHEEGKMLKGAVMFKRIHDPVLVCDYIEILKDSVQHGIENKEIDITSEFNTALEFMYGNQQ